MTFEIGARVRENFWVDRRPEVWYRGTIVSGPFDLCGAVAYRVAWDGGGEWDVAAELLEADL